MCRQTDINVIKTKSTTTLSGDVKNKRQNHFQHTFGPTRPLKRTMAESSSIRVETTNGNDWSFGKKYTRDRSRLHRSKVASYTDRVAVSPGQKPIIFGGPSLYPVSDEKEKYQAHTRLSSRAECLRNHFIR